MSSPVRQSAFCLLWLCVFLALGFCFASDAFSQSAKSPSKSSPRPPTPEQKLAAARARLAHVQQQVKSTWSLLKQSRDGLAKAQQEYEDVIEQLRSEETEDPLLRETGVRINEARTALETQRKRALDPLRLNFAFGKLQGEQRAAAIRLDELILARQQAQASRLPFDRESQAEIGQLSLSVLKLNDEVAAMEDERLDQHEGYQAANEAMDQALAEAAEAVKTSRELREGNPRRQAAAKSLQTAYAEAAAAGKAYAEARRQRQLAVAGVAVAQSEFDAARRR